MLNEWLLERERAGSMLCTNWRHSHYGWQSDTSLAMSRMPIWWLEGHSSWAIKINNVQFSKHNIIIQWPFLICSLHVCVYDHHILIYMDLNWAETFVYMLKINSHFLSMHAKWTLVSQLEQMQSTKDIKFQSITGQAVQSTHKALKIHDNLK